MADLNEHPSWAAAEARVKKVMDEQEIVERHGVDGVLLGLRSALVLLAVYATQLNERDGGARLVPTSVEDWLRMLKEGYWPRPPAE